MIHPLGVSQSVCENGFVKVTAKAAKEEIGSIIWNGKNFPPFKRVLA
jgi:hypothetical protein